MSMGGSAPKFMSKMSRHHVPYAGILATLGVYVVGVFLNYLVPSQVFEIVLNGRFAGHHRLVGIYCGVPDAPAQGDQRRQGPQTSASRCRERLLLPG
ncbi:L-asparagine permease [Klebsiella oxytoca]|nr:L-asparagine permease [Klebsiella oxytoca]